MLGSLDNTVSDMFRGEADAIVRTLDSSLDLITKSIYLLSSCTRLFTCGAGASALVAKEIAGQCLETGIYCYPLTNDLAEAQPISFSLGGYEDEALLAEYYSHLVNPGDGLIAVSVSGETGFVYELARIVKSIYKSEVPVISITENKDSMLARYSDIVILTKGKPENPSASKTQTCQLVVGHTLILGLASYRRITDEDMIHYMVPKKIANKPMGWK